MVTGNAYDSRVPAERGNLTYDSVVDFRDIDPFVLALSDPAAGAVSWPHVGHAPNVAEVIVTALAEPAR